MKTTAQMGGFEKWWDTLPDSLPHHTKDQMRFAWDAACASLESVRSEALEPAGETWTRNIFSGEPPPSYKSWFDFCASRVKTGVLLRAATPQDWIEGAEPRVECTLSPARVAEGDTICKSCRGSGTVRGMTYGHGPDDYETDVECPDCKGTGESPAKEQPGERRKGKYRLVYNKVTKKIDKINNFSGLAVESFDPPTEYEPDENPPPPERP